MCGFAFFVYLAGGKVYRLATDHTHDLHGRGFPAHGERNYNAAHIPFSHSCSAGAFAWFGGLDRLLDLRIENAT
jgi:hypothetical protein